MVDGSCVTQLVAESVGVPGKDLHHSLQTETDKAEIAAAFSEGLGEASLIFRYLGSVATGARRPQAWREQLGWGSREAAAKDLCWGGKPEALKQ